MSIEDISVSGAKITHAIDAQLPARFVLSFSRNGDVRRQCQTAWRAGNRIGVHFIEINLECNGGSGNVLRPQTK